MKARLYSLLIVMLAALSFSSCLDDEYLVDWDKAKPVIELPYTRHLVTQTVEQGTDAVFDLMVNYTIANWRDQNSDIAVELGIDASQTGSYTLLPASAYTLPAMTIAKQTQLATTEFKINTTELEKGTYALPIVIKGVPLGYTISGNFGSVVFRVTVK